MEGGRGGESGKQEGEEWRVGCRRDGRGRESGKQEGGVKDDLVWRAAPGPGGRQYPPHRRPWPLQHHAPLTTTHTHSEGARWPPVSNTILHI